MTIRFNRKSSSMKNKITAGLLLISILSLTSCKSANNEDETTAPKFSGKDQVVEGDPFTNHYGVVQVKVTFQAGKIKDITTLLAPSGKSNVFTEMSIPVLKEEVIKNQSTKVELVSGATATSASYLQSIQSAIDAIQK